MDEREAEIREYMRSMEFPALRDLAYDDAMHLLSLLSALRKRAEEADRRADELLGEENLQARWTLEAQQERDHLRGELREIAEMIRTSGDICLCNEILHKIEGIPGMENKA
jgi:hypothetical protein